MHKARCDLHNDSPIVSSARRLIALILLLLWAGCSRDTDLSVVNRSSIAITNVVIVGSGFSERIERIPAGAERTLTIRPRGESAASVSFDAGVQHVETTEQGYFEGGGDYRVQVIIEPDLKITVSSAIRPF